MKKLFNRTLTLALSLALSLALFWAAESPSLAQEQPAQQPTAEELQKQKEEREKNAYRLLDQVIDESQTLRLVENRVRVQIGAADALWNKNPGRARSLFSMAAEGVAELGRTPQPTGNRRNEGNPDRRAFQLRQELVLAAARHDAQLAYQLLATTKPPAPVAQNTNTDQRNPRQQFDAEDNLEQMLLGRIASLDPKLAAQNAEQMIEKGQFPRSLGEVINQLYREDPEAAAKLGDKTVKRILASNILTNNDAANLAQSLLNAGIRPPAASATTDGTAPANARGPILDQSAYVELLSAAIDAALKVAPPAPGNARPATAATPQRGRGAGGAPSVVAPPPRVAPGGPTEAQIEQGNGRRLLAALMIALPAVDQYLPAKAPALRQKFTELGVGNLANMGQRVSFPQGTMTTDSLVQAAANAPTPMQDRLYQQAALRAIEEGNTDRARQIAADHLPVKARDYVLQRVEYREMVAKTDSSRIDEIRQRVARAGSDGEKIELLIELAANAQKSANPKLAMQLLDEAKQITNRRATSYEQFNQQMRVARAFSTADPARSFEVLEPAIGQLNELLAAAAILNGFEINMFRDGEMTMQGGNTLTVTISRFGQEIANLARTDLEHAEILAGRFQLAEPRIMARLSIVQALLNPRPGQLSGNFGFNSTRFEPGIVRP